jgi:predicted ester cyclase
MLLQSILLDFWDSVNGREKTREMLTPYATDEALFQQVELFEKGFPMYRLKAEDIIEQGDKVVVRARISGTHLGEFNGIPATGRSIDLPFMIIYRFEGGKIAEHWMEANHLALLTQLGVINAAAQSA